MQKRLLLLLCSCFLAAACTRKVVEYQEKECPEVVIKAPEPPKAPECPKVEGLLEYRDKCFESITQREQQIDALRRQAADLRDELNSARAELYEMRNRSNSTSDY